MSIVNSVKLVAQTRSRRAVFEMGKSARTVALPVRPKRDSVMQTTPRKVATLRNVFKLRKIKEGDRL
jgi:hypothetical protein